MLRERSLRSRDKMSFTRFRFLRNDIVHLERKSVSRTPKTPRKSAEGPEGSGTPI